MAAKQKGVNVEVHLENVRLSFPKIFRPDTIKGVKDGNNEPAFSASFLLSKTTESGKANVKKMTSALAEVFRSKWPDGHPNKTVKPDNRCLRDGDLEEIEGYEGHYYVSSRAPQHRRPVVVDANRRPLKEEDGRPYAGCFVDAIVRVWAQDNEYGRRLNASLEAVQFRAHGEAFGAKAVDPNEVFADLSDGTDVVAADDPFGDDDDFLS